jgi:tetratricopeptide (TPR) repeat protein
MKEEQMERHIDAGLRFHEQEPFRKARAEFDEAIRPDPQSAEANSLRGRAYRELDQFERAIADFDASIRLDPQFKEAYIVRGTAYWDLNLY